MKTTAPAPAPPKYGGSRLRLRNTALKFLYLYIGLTSLMFVAQKGYTNIIRILCVYMNITGTYLL